MVEILSAKENEADHICQQGIDLCDTEEYKEAHKLFQKAYEMYPTSPKIMSWLGYTSALVENKVASGVQLCKKAIDSDIPDAMFYRNIGKLYLMQKNKRAAIGAFSKGLQIDKGNRYILKEWKVLGFRRTPFLKFLPREHGLNKFFGRLTWNMAQKKAQKN